MRTTKSLPGLSVTESDPTDFDYMILARDMRTIEQQDLLRVFDSVELGLREVWAISSFRRVIRMWDNPIAMYGVAVGQIEGVGVPWMLCADFLSYAGPITVMKQARALFEEITKDYPVLYNTVPHEDVEAQALLDGLGFEVLRDRPVEQYGHSYVPFWYGRVS